MTPPTPAPSATPAERSTQERAQEVYTRLWGGKSWNSEANIVAAIAKALAAAERAAAEAERERATKLESENAWMRRALTMIAPVLRAIPWTGAPNDRAIDAVLRTADAIIAAQPAAAGGMKGNE